MKDLATCSCVLGGQRVQTSSPKKDAHVTHVHVVLKETIG